MTGEIILLTWTAAGIGLIHTLTGPDHYLPFIVMGRARRWSLFRTLSITMLCGVGHVLGSVVLGFIGIGAGIAAEAGTPRASLTPWVLFIIFVLGPCEPLIPLLMFPAAQSSLSKGCRRGAKDTKISC